MSQEELAAAIRQYIEDPDLRLDHGRSAHSRAREYTLDRQVERFEGIYRALGVA
ncbi:MAG: hypothetical protein ABFS30_18180 [Pseudomonadota bacterium]